LAYTAASANAVGSNGVASASLQANAVTSGFWVLPIAVQTPGAPVLTIFLTATNTAVVAWPSPSTGWVLQQNTNGVASGNWSDVGQKIKDDGTTRWIVIDPPIGIVFYRLKRS
jgi:hypothetical protein